MNRGRRCGPLYAAWLGAVAGSVIVWAITVSNMGEFGPAITGWGSWVAVVPFLQGAPIGCLLGLLVKRLLRLAVFLIRHE